MGECVVLGAASIALAQAGIRGKAGLEVGRLKLAFRFGLQPANSVSKETPNCIRQNSIRQADIWAVNQDN